MTSINLVTFGEDGFPSCEKHGAMSCVNIETTIYRCPVCHIGICMRNVFRYVESELQGNYIVSLKE